MTLYVENWWISYYISIVKYAWIYDVWIVEYGWVSYDIMIEENH